MQKGKPLPPSLVLDTHAWVWVCSGNRRCGFLAGYEGRYTLPAIALWEVSMLAEKGRLGLEPSVAEWIEDNTQPPIFIQPLTIPIATLSARLDGFHGDPADRMVVATSLVLQQPLVTADGEIQRWFGEQPQLANMVFGI